MLVKILFLLINILLINLRGGQAQNGTNDTNGTNGTYVTNGTNGTDTYVTNASNVTEIINTTVIIKTTLNITTTFDITTTLDPYYLDETASTPDNVYGNIDLRLVYIFNTFYPDLNDLTVASLCSNSTLYGPYFDNITNEQWLDNCDVASNYYSLLEDLIVYENDNGSFVTYNRLNPLLGCLEDCDFYFLLSVPSPFTNQDAMDTTAFATNALAYLSTEAAFYCQYTFDSLAVSEDANSTYYLNNMNMLSLADPEILESFSPEEALALATKLSSLGKYLPDAQSEALGANIPEDTPLDNITSVVNSVSLGCFDSTLTDTLTDLIPKLKLDRMDDSRKIYFGSSIASVATKTSLEKLLKATTDQAIIDTIPSFLFENLNIDILTIPTSSVPDSYLKTYAAKQLVSKCLSAVTDMNLLGKIVSGFTSDKLDCILDTDKKATIVNIVQSALNNSIDLSSIQRASLLSSLVNSLSTLLASTNESIYLKNITKSEALILYPLFIEANATILNAFVKFSTFDSVVTQVATIPVTKCCLYSRAGLTLFTSYAVSKKFSYTQLSASDLDKLGPCLYSHLPINILQSLDPSVFVKKFSVLGNVFQPDTDEITAVQALIKSYATNTTLTKSKNTLVFTTLSDLAVFYPFATLSESLTSWKTSGGSLYSKMMQARDPTLSTNNLCQVGLNSTDTETITALLDVYKNALINQVFGSSAKRTAVNNYTCDKLKQVGKGVTGLSVTQLGLINQTEYNKCESVFGAITTWSTAQLGVFASRAKTAYGSAAALTDKNIGSLGSIMQGFSAADLATLNLTQATSINSLGSLTKWTSDQISALNAPVSKFITTYSSNTIGTKFMSSAGNLLCGVPSSQISTTYISDSVFQLSVGAASKISIDCPNIANWYAYARSSSRYKTKRATTPALSASALTELGTVVAGITIADLQTLPKSSMSSISAAAFQYMPAATVNALSADQLSGLATSQISALQNSPYYASFSTNIKNGLTALVANTVVPVFAKSSGSILGFNLIALITCLILSFSNEY